MGESMQMRQMVSNGPPHTELLSFFFLQYLKIKSPHVLTVFESYWKAQSQYYPKDSDTFPSPVKMQQKSLLKQFQSF